jgi:hypothetical protein
MATAISEFIGKLYSEMAQPADSLYHDKVSWNCPAVTQGIESGNSGAE